MSDLHSLQQEYARALQAESDAKAAEKDAQKKYDNLLKELLDERPDLKAAAEEVEQRAQDTKARKKHVKEVDAQARELLEQNFINKDELPDGISQRRNKRIDFDEDALFELALQHHNIAQAFLQVNTDAVESLMQFVKEYDDGFVFPMWLQRMLPGVNLTVVTTPQPWISKSTLKKLDLPGPVPVTAEGDSLESETDDTDKEAVDELPF